MANKYYGFDIETNKDTGALYLWCISECDNFKKLIDNPKEYPIKSKCYGTTWDDFFKFLDKIPQNSTIFIHNMEFDFNGILANCSNFDARYKIDNDLSIITGFHSFIKIKCEKFTILDSAKITMMSIYGIGELLGIPKLEEDYNGIVTDASIKYCYRDTELSLRGVAYFCNAYGCKSIPITATGYNKKAINKQVDKLNKYIAVQGNNNLKDVQDNNKKFNELVRKEYNGGVCYCNMFYAGTIVDSASCDIGSSYPTAMQGYLYPDVNKTSLTHIDDDLKKGIINTFKKTSPYTAFRTGNLCALLGNRYTYKGFLCKVTIKGKCKLHIFNNNNYFPLISMTKRRKSETHDIKGLYIESFHKLKTAFNKLLYMDENDALELACNEYDLYMLLHCYDIDDITINYGYMYNMCINKFLINIVDTFLVDKNLCKDKDTDINKWNNKAFYNLLKISEDTADVELYKFVYQRTKACVNGTYGINVEDKQKDKYILQDGCVIRSFDTHNSNKSPYNELVGSYISCYGRWQLFTAFMGVVENGGINYYSDTDSIKVGGCNINDVVAYYNIAFGVHWYKLEQIYKDYKRPTTNGIGYLEQEDIKGYINFKFVSLGSKNYICKAGDTIKATISGVRNASKIFTDLYNKSIDFNDMVNKYYHYGLIIKNNKLVPNYSKLGEPCENGNTCVILQNSDFSLMASNTGKLNKIALETIFNNYSKLFERKEIEINGN